MELTLPPPEPSPDPGGAGALAAATKKALSKLLGLCGVAVDLAADSQEGAAARRRLLAFLPEAAEVRGQEGGGVGVGVGGKVTGGGRGGAAAASGGRWATRAPCHHAPAPTRPRAPCLRQAVRQAESGGVGWDVRAANLRGAMRLARQVRRRRAGTR